MYQALYRKYRPMDFDSVVGQSSIVKTLKNSIIHHSFSHAYLFIGPRGTGKTTISKIFARDINCLDPKDGCACGKCSACLYSFSKECMDILEIDAASNNGVDEIRELRNKISLVPTELKYKVYIIDEVHMLSIGAFNALLKTLEEPPEHAVFILATTDPQKIPETIVSRCQTFSFQNFNSSFLFDRLDFVCKKEKIDIDPEVLSNIADISDGGMRDALGLLDKLYSFSNGKITLDDFYEINGVVSNSDLSKLLDYILTGNISEFLNLLHKFDYNGKNLIQIMNQLLIYTRNLLVDYYLNKNNINYSINLIEKFASTINENMFDIKKSSNTIISIELFILKFINDNVLVNNNISIADSSINTTNSIDEEEIVENSSVDNDKKDESDVSIVVRSDENSDEDVFNDDIVDNDSSINTLSSFSNIINIDEIIKARVNNTLAFADKNLLKEEAKLFDLLKDFTFDQQIGYIVCALLDSNLRVVSADSIILSYDSTAIVKQNLSILDKMMEVYSKITGSSKKIAIISDDEWNSLKNEYISNLKNGIKYNFIPEPEVIFEESDKDDIIASSAIDLFGDIVEIE